MGEKTNYSGIDEMNSGVERKSHWESFYLQKPVAETSWHQAIPQMSLEMVERADVSPDTAIIDIGGGASLLGDHLLERGFRDVTILDISRAAQVQAQTRLGEHSARLKWVEADVTRFKPQRRYGLWHDRAAFHFLTETEDRKKYASVLELTLDSGGQAIIATFSPSGPKKCSGLEIVQYDTASIEQALGPAFRLLEMQEDVHLTPDGREQRFNYFRFLKNGPG